MKHDSAWCTGSTFLIGFNHIVLDPTNKEMRDREICMAESVPSQNVEADTLFTALWM